MTLDPRHLRQVLALTHHRHFGRAAAALGISQPALSRSLRGLEDALGAPLFDRTGHGAVPTRLGAHLASRAEGLVREFDDLGREIAALSGEVAGAVRIAAGQFPVELSVAAALGELLAESPDLQAELHCSDWREVTLAVLEGRADLGVAEISEAAENPVLEVEPLADHRLALFCRSGHPLIGASDLEAADVLGHPWVAIPGPPRMARHLPDDLGRALRRDPRTGDVLPAIYAVGTVAAREVVMRSDALGVATPVQIEAALAAGQAALLPFHAGWLRLQYGFLWARQRWQPPAVRRLMELVRRHDAGVAMRQAELWARYGPDCAGGESA